MKAYRNYCLLCTVEISPEIVFTDDIPPSPLSPHIHQPAKLPAWESTALFSIRTHQVSLNRWIKPNPSLVYYLFSARNWTLENALALISMLETNVKESLFPCLISTQPPSKSGSCLGAIAKKTTKAETPGAKCVLLVWICPGWTPAGHPGVPQLSSQWLFSEGGRQSGQRHDFVPPLQQGKSTQKVRGALLRIGSSPIFWWHLSKQLPIH